MLLKHPSQGASHAASGAAARHGRPSALPRLPARARPLSRPPSVSQADTKTDGSKKPLTPTAAPTKGSAPATAPEAPPRPSPAPSGPPGGPPDPKKKPSKSRGEILITRLTDDVYDAFSDVGRHLGRQLSNTQPKMLRSTTASMDGGGIEIARLDKPVMLVLGSGWGAHAIIKVIDTEQYDVIVVSPRNHFMFTPMLPSSAVGTVEFRSLLEPIRISNEYVTYLEASADHIDLNNKVATCVAESTASDGYHPTFQVSFDVLVVAVGEQPATLGVPGVAEHCFFMKEISDTVKLRTKILSNFELAALPGTPDAEIRRLLHFCIVGGGPTGVEFAGTLSDYLGKDLRRKFPELMDFVKVTLLQSAKAILTQFDAKLSQRAMENLRDTGVEVRTGVRVTQVTDTQVVLKGGERMDCGLCVWSAGNSSRPLVQSLVDVIPDQAGFQRGPATSFKLATDPYLRVIGARDVMALGDCSSVQGREDTLPPTAQVAAQQGAYVAHMLNRGYVLGVGGLEEMAPRRLAPTGVTKLIPGSSPLSSMTEAAQMAATRSEGAVVSMRRANGQPVSIYDITSDLVSRPDAEVEEYRRVFEFLSLGIMAYVGNDKAAIDTQMPVGQGGSSLNIYGSFAYLLWRSVYITKQVSLRNRVLILFDWIKAKFFGRDLSMF